MFKNFRERLTYKQLSMSLGLLIVLVIGIYWVTDTPLPIIGNRHEPFLYVLGILGGFALVIFPRLSTDAPIFKKGVSATQRKSNRNKMLELVEKIWITGYLDHLLNDIDVIKLDLHFAEAEKVMRLPSMGGFNLADTSKIKLTFNDLNQRLVILGEPGSGKTVVLLQLAKELIEDARRDESKPIPIVFTLASWAAKKLPLESWLIDELRLKYNVSKTVASDLVKGEQLLYLFDGLDEVKVESRNACLSEIKRFAERERPISYILCSRKTEYDELKNRLRLIGLVVLQPLTPKQIATFLSSDELHGLRSCLADSLSLQKFAQVPFTLNIMAFVMRLKKERDIRLLIEEYKSEDELRDSLLKSYLEMRLHDPILRNERFNDLRKTRLRLQWLAAQLDWRSETDFFIESLQPSWLANNRTFIFYYLLIAIFMALPLAFISTIFAGFVQDDLFRWSGLTALWVWFWTFIRTNHNRPIQLVDRFGWSIRYSFNLIPLSFFLMGTITTDNKLVTGLVSMAFAALVLGFHSAENVGLRTYPNQGAVRSLRFFVIGTLIIGLPIGGGIALILGLAFINNLLLAIIVGGISGFIAAIFLGSFIAAEVGLFTDLEETPNISLLAAGRSFLQHWILRFFLHLEGFVPYWHYDNFLDYCTDLMILRKVGGGYRFTHDYLQDYLANEWFAQYRIDDITH